jgi:hypothetical protein
MKFSVLFAGALLALSSTAAFADIECVRVDDADDWRVNISSDFSMASFFDNDHETALAMTDSKYLESLPPQWVYTYEGNDEGSKLSFSYNATRKTGTLTDAIGTRKEYTVEFSCESVKGGLINWKETRQALDNAQKNSGSTRY